MRPKLPAMLALAALSAGVAPAAATEPDVSITATVRARSVTFHSKPVVHVGLTGSPGRRDVDHTWRDNLPEEVQPDRTYHDVGIRFEASTTLDPAAVDPLSIDIDADSPTPADEDSP